METGKNTKKSTVRVVKKPLDKTNKSDKSDKPDKPDIKDTKSVNKEKNQTSNPSTDSNVKAKTLPKQTRSKRPKPRSNQTKKTNKSAKGNENDELIETNHILGSTVNNNNSTNTISTDTPHDSEDFPMSPLLLNYNIEDEKRKDNEEEILSESNFRLAIKPINTHYQIFWDLYKKQFEAIWSAEEIDFCNDRHDFLKMDKNVQHFIKCILAFFAGADSIVNINIRKKFSKITVKEAEVAYGFQQMMENIHGEVYIDMLINIITDPIERDNLINAFKNVKSIKKMIQWAQRWIDSERRIAFSIVVFCIFEGLMFSGAFASIYWLKKFLGEDKMKGLTQSNNLIAKDEGMHTNFGCVMYDYVVHKLSNEEMSILITEAVDICKEFTKDAIRVDMIGMNVNLMHQYVEYVADRLLVCLKHEKLFNTPNPDQFQFMDTIGFLNKDNFFERRATEYQKAYSDRNRANWTFKILKVY